MTKASAGADVKRARLADRIRKLEAEQAHMIDQLIKLERMVQAAFLNRD